MADVEEHHDANANRGILYRLDPDLTCHAMDDGIGIVNGKICQDTTLPQALYQAMIHLFLSAYFY